MSDEVKFIFKTLFKVPVIIFVSFFILNIFAFFFIYFKVLGASYVVMQTAVENNYLPTAELNQLINFVDEWNDIPMVATGSAGVVVGKNANGTDVYVNNRDGHRLTEVAYAAKDARTRQQYGGTVTCGVRAQYKIVWPLDYKETTVNETGVNGLATENNENYGQFQGFKDEEELAEDRAAKDGNLTISISYTVPGLKYYPDLLTY